MAVAWRGVFDWSEESSAWRASCSPFKEKYGSSVPKFESKAEAIAFIKANCTVGSNPEDPKLKHIYSMMYSWDQIERYLIPKILDYRQRFRSTQSALKPEPTSTVSKRRREPDGEPPAEGDPHGWGVPGPTEAALQAMEDEREQKRRRAAEGGEHWPPSEPAEAPPAGAAPPAWMAAPDAPAAGMSTGSADWQRPRVYKGYEGNRYLLDSLDGEEWMFEGKPLDVGAVRRSLLERLDLPFHAEMTDASVMNTLKYLFFHMKCGIYVMIRGGRLRIFAPFTNSSYRNKWGGALSLCTDDGSGSLASYEGEKAKYYPHEENYLEDRNAWWANGNIICNVASESHWGDQFLTPIRDMLETLCAERAVPDVEFFVNKRDYPHLKFNPGDPSRGLPPRPVEPYGFIFDRDDRDAAQDVELDGEHKYPSYAPILSFYCSPRFADLPVPPSEDWEAATGLVYAGTFRHTINEAGDVELDGTPRDLFTERNLRKFERAWEDKIDVAFFRGSASGGGVTAETNQRVHLSLLSAKWKTHEVYGGNVYGGKLTDAAAAAGEAPRYPFLDAALTAWNGRDKKIASRPMTFLKPRALREQGVDAGRQNFTPIFDQSRFKYIVYVEGHCAACRYAFMMRLGSVIIKVESQCVAGDMWYFPLLRPYYDHVPVKEDLSDLAQQLQWCRDHDDECRRIAANAQRLYDTFANKDAVLDYMQMLINDVALRWRHAPAWWEAPEGVGRPRPPPAEELQRLAGIRVPAEGRDFCCGRKEVLCSACQADYDAQQRIRSEAQSKQIADVASRQNSRKAIKQRQRERARARKAARERGEGGGEAAASKTHPTMKELLHGAR